MVKLIEKTLGEENSLVKTERKKEMLGYSS